MNKMFLFLKDSILPWGYGCNHAVFLESCNHEENEYTIWTWGSLVIDIPKNPALTSSVFRWFRLLRILEVDRMLGVIFCCLQKELVNFGNGLFCHSSFHLSSIYRDSVWQGTAVTLTREILLGFPTTQRGFPTAPDSYIPAWNTGALCHLVNGAFSLGSWCVSLGNACSAGWSHIVLRGSWG